MINTRFLLTPNEQKIEAARGIQVFWQRLSHLWLYNLSTKTLALICKDLARDLVSSSIKYVVYSVINNASVLNTVHDKNIPDPDHTAWRLRVFQQEA